MRQLLVEISFCGKNYHGYQVQKNALAVADVLQDCIKKVIGVREDIIGCSRTDTGVHANSYYFTMKTSCRIQGDSLLRGLNHILPNDIVIKQIKEVDLSFHPRYNCIKKEYLYIIHNAPLKDPFRAGMVLEYPYNMDEKLMDTAARMFVGTHDFRGVCGINRKIVEDTVRTVYESTVYRLGDDVVFRIVGDGFLYKMVRIIVGTLISVNEGKLNCDDIKNILSSQTRDSHSKTAPPDGLYLNKIYFDEVNYVTRKGGYSADY